MKALHELLRNYVEKSSYTVYSLSYASKVNRTTLQRALNGERPISQENLNRILPFLKLTLSEKAELDKAFLISQIGELTYEKHMYIKDLLERIEVLGTVDGKSDSLPFVPSGSITDSAQIIKGNFNIIKTICQAASCCIRDEKEPFLYTIAHFQNRFFKDLYEQLQIPFYKDLQIRHITPFIKATPDNEDCSLFNLRVLSTLFPFALSNPANCTLYYCYESYLITETSTIPFSYFIVCNRQVFLLSADCETAMVLPEHVVSYYTGFFNRILQSSRELTASVNTASYLSAFLECAKDAKFINTIESQPCVTAFIDAGMIAESINNELPAQYQQMLTDMLATQNHNLKRMVNSGIVFTRRGYDNFVQNGIIEQIPLDLYHPLSIQNRILILGRMVQAISNDTYHFYMIKEDSFHPRIEIMAYDTTHMLLNYHNPDTDRVQTCMIREPGMISTFTDFMHSLADHDLVYSLEDTKKLLQQSIQSLKEALPPPNKRS